MGNLHNKSKLFVYGEVLQDGNVDNIGAYESFMSVTASNLGGAVRNALTLTNLSSLGTNLCGVDSNKAVDFVETHDTYEDGSKPTTTTDYTPHSDYKVDYDSSSLFQGKKFSVRKLLSKYDFQEQF